LKGLKAIVFDLDGVIFDSLEANIALYDHILSALGRKPAARLHAQEIHRLTLEESLRLLLEGDEQLVKQGMEYWRGMDPSPFIEMLRLNPGADQALNHLKERFVLGVGTNRTYTARPSLAHFGLDGLFKTIVTPLEVGEGKPSPMFMERILAELGVGSHEAVYVGDSVVDEQLCRASGVRLVAFGNPELEAWAHVKGFKELVELVDGE